MKYITFRIACLALLLTSFRASAEEGVIRGTVLEDANGEPLFGVTVQIKGTTNGAITDFEGKFEIVVEPGVYDVQASFVSFQTVTIMGLEVSDEEVTLIDQIRLREDVELLEEVVITAEVIKTTEAALLTVKRKSANLIDGISAANFREIGDSDAAGAVKRVTGVSVEGGKYVYVRGLGDRYTKTMMNDMDIPGLDPDRNSLQIDIFPTNLIDNMIVMKSASADMPADFTGGVVNIETKDFPDSRILDVSLGITYNPSMHFNKDYLSYEGSSTDWLGFDNGTRALPNGARGEMIPSPLSGHTDEEVGDFLRTFNPTLGGQKQTSFLDYSLGVSTGNQFSLNNGNKLGYIFSTTYKSSTKFYDNAFYGEYQRPNNSDQYELVYANVQEGRQSEYNVLLGGLAGVAYKTDNSKYRLTAMHLQNGESKAAQFYIDDNGSAVGKSGYLGLSNNLFYGQRGLTNLLINGEHFFDEGNWNIDWRISPTISTIRDPDIRKTAFTHEANDTTFVAGAAGNPSRIWRYLDEVNVAGRVDLTREYSSFGLPSKLKFGLSYVFKERDYEILSYSLLAFGRQPDYDGTPEDVLTPDNLWPNGNLYYQSRNSVPNPNQYNSTVDNFSLYASNEFNPIPGLKAIVGLRAENYVQRHTGRDQEFASLGTGNNLDGDKVLDSFDLFPSLNLVYSLKEQQNLRVSYSKTIARPSFKELSFAQILDPISNRIFNGSLFDFNGWDGQLSETRIDNYDIRWELFMQGNQLLSVSAYYKAFDKPIELVRIPEAQTSNEFQPRNVGNGRVYGVEVEIRKNLVFLSQSLQNFSIAGNYTITKSEIDMTPIEFNARKNFEKVGQTVSDTREMAGQAPYILNAGISYESPKARIDAGLFYNMKGSTLVVVGGGLFPDVYSEPFHSLNFNVNKTMGPKDNISLNFSINNILNDVQEEFYAGFNAEDQHFTRLNPGTSFGFGIGYSF